MFSKKDLKDNDIVYYRNGSKRAVILDINENISCYTLSQYIEDLIEDNNREGLDIMKVKRLKPTIIYERKEILSKKEREYLSNVINPFKEKVKFISKNSNGLGYEYIEIAFINNLSMCFPSFKKGTMYKDMELLKDYTLEELELY